MRRILLLLAVLAPGCRSRTPAAEPSGPGVISVRWTGSDTGRFAATAEALWCARDSLLEIVAVRNDTAIGLSLVAQDSLRTGGYPVYHTEVYAPWRPQAGVALRWLDSTDLKRFGGARGQVTVTEGGSRRVTGTLEVGVQATPGRDSLHLTGSFSGLPIGSASPACGRANKPGPA